MNTPIDVDEDNKWKHDSEFVQITKNLYDTCFISNFSREIDWELSQICQWPPIHAYRRIISIQQRIYGCFSYRCDFRNSLNLSCQFPLSVKTCRRNATSLTGNNLGKRSNCQSKRYDLHLKDYIAQCTGRPRHRLATSWSVTWGTVSSTPRLRLPTGTIK